jgi:hypothetical protein
MKDAGFEYPLALQFASRRHEYDATRGVPSTEFIDRWQLGIYTDRQRESTEFAVSDVLAAKVKPPPSPKVSPDYYDALMGVWAEDGGQPVQQDPTKGCMGSALRRSNPLVWAMNAAPSDVRTGFDNFDGDVERDPGVRTSSDSWSRCMKDNGHDMGADSYLVLQSYVDGPGRVRPHGKTKVRVAAADYGFDGVVEIPRYTPSELRKGVDFERRVAALAVDCENRSHLNREISAARDRLLAAWLDRHAAHLKKFSDEELEAARARSSEGAYAPTGAD